MSEKIRKPGSPAIGISGHREIRPTATGERTQQPRASTLEPVRLPPIHSSGATERGAITRHAARPKLERMWGLPAPLHEAYRIAAAAKRPTTTILGTHANADEAIALAGAFPDRTVFALRGEHFDETIKLPTGHLIIYRGQWFSALEDIKPKPNEFGLCDNIIVLPDALTRRAVNPYQFLRSLLTHNGRLSVLVKTHDEAARLAGEFRTVFTKEKTEVVYVFGFAYFDEEMMLVVNPLTGDAEGVDAMDIESIGATHFGTAAPGQESPFYWVLASRADRRP